MINKQVQCTRKNPQGMTINYYLHTLIVVSERGWLKKLYGFFWKNIFTIVWRSSVSQSDLLLYVNIITFISLVVHILPP